MDELAERVSKRSQFLRRLYRVTSGNSRTIVRAWEDIGQELGFTRSETDQVAQYLEGGGMIKFRTEQGGVSITHEGIVQAEKELAQQITTSASKVEQQTQNVGRAVEDISQATVGDHGIAREVDSLKSSFSQLSGSVVELQRDVTSMGEQFGAFSEQLPHPQDVWPQQVVQMKFGELRKRVDRLEEDQRAQAGIVLARWQVWLGVAALILTTMTTILAILQWLGYL